MDELQEEIEAQGTELRVRAPEALAGTAARAANGVITVTATHELAVGDRVELFAPAALADVYTVASVAENGQSFTFASGVTEALASASASFYPFYSLNPKTFSGPSGSASVIDVTTLSSKAKNKRMGLRDEGQISFTVHYVPGNVGHELLRAARKARKAATLELAFSDEDTFWQVQGYVLSFPISGAVDGVIESNVTFEIDGEILEY
jgi:hypothetical protein